MGTWQIVRSSWKIACNSISAIGVLAVIFLTCDFVESSLQLQLVQIAPRGFSSLISLVAWCLVLPFINGVCLSLANAKLGASPASSSLVALWKGGERLYGRLLGCYICVLGMMVILAAGANLTFQVVAIADSGTAPAVAVTSTLVLTMVFGILLYMWLVSYVMSPVAIALEGVGVFTGIRRGLEVGRVALNKLALVCVALTLTLLPMAVFLIPHLLWYSGATIMQGWLLLGALSRSVVQSLVSVLFAAALVQLYQGFAGSIQQPLLPAEEAAESKKRVIRRLWLWPLIVLGLIIVVPGIIFFIAILFGRIR